MLIEKFEVRGVGHPCWRTSNATVSSKQV